MNKNKTVVTFVFVFCFLVSFCELDIVKAESLTVSIHEDGSIEGTDKILRDGNRYTLTDSFNGSLIVKKNSTIIDGAGFTLLGEGEGAGTAGISLRARNCTVINFKIENYFFGIDANSYSNSIFGNIIKNCRSGIYSLGGYSTIKYNTFEYNHYSIDSYYSPNPNIITNNNFKSYRGEYVMIVYLGAPPTIDSNYWSRYYGRDTNGDGIGDTPHVFEGPNNVQDDHPLMKPVDITVVPEFSSGLILVFFCGVCLVIVVVKKKWKEDP